VPALLRGHSDPCGRRISALRFGRDGGCRPRKRSVWGLGGRDAARYGRRGGGGMAGGQVGARERERKNKEAACDGEVLAFWTISLPAGVRAAATSGSEWKSRERSK
jgi:hypothetical protein